MNIERGIVVATRKKPAHFDARLIDGDPQLLNAGYRLRYQVYCLERGFIRAEDHPDGLERDAFDRHSVHVGAVNGRGVLVGTARVVDLDVSTLPLFARCTMFSDERALHRAGNKVVEVSRVVVSRTYNQRQGDEHYGLQGSNPSSDRGRSGVTKRRGRRGELVLCVLKACYQASKRIGATHWIVAIEKPLQCLLAQYGFTLRVIGPERDYFGQVAPHLMDLSEFEAVILSNRIPALDDFLVGLEPEFSPRQYASS